MSCAAIILGIAIGCYIKIFSETEIEIINVIEFDPNAFFLIILPPIMFDAGFSMDRLGFFQNIGTILTFSLLGTFIVACSFGFLIFWSSFIFPFTITLYESFLYGSLIAAVDPVAVLAVFEALKVTPILKVIVFGESALNDAVSVALFWSFMTSHYFNIQTL